jgi:hypothetical protein
MSLDSIIKKQKQKQEYEPEDHQEYHGYGQKRDHYEITEENIGVSHLPKPAFHICENLRQHQHELVNPTLFYTHPP